MIGPKFSMTGAGRLISGGGCAGRGVVGTEVGSFRAGIKPDRLHARLATITILIAKLRFLLFCISTT
jgi:hypothetical protein